MKIMFNISSLGKGGAERVISNLANNFISDNKVSILVNNNNLQSYKLNENVKIFELDSKYIKNPLIRNIKRIKNAKNIINDYNPDIIISFMPWPSYKVLLLKNKINCKVIVSDRNDPKMEYNNIIEKILMRYLYPKADFFVFQTSDQRKFFSKKIQDKSVVIPNPLKENFLVDKEAKKENVIISVGRLVEQKNHKLTIDAFKEIITEFPNYKLKIFGTGNLEKELKDYIKNIGMSEKIFLCGVSDDIQKELIKSKIFVMSSNYEGMPNALMEAMACGIACVSTDCPCGGPKELITDNENGLLFDVGNKDMLVEKLRLLLKNESLQKKIGNNAKRIRYDYNPQKINEKWQKCINEVINR